MRHMEAQLRHGPVHARTENKPLFLLQFRCDYTHVDLSNLYKKLTVISFFKHILLEN